MGRVSQASLEQTIPAGVRLLLDSSTLIAHFNGNEPASPAATVVIDDFVTSGRNEAIISAVSVMEILVQPLRHSPGGHHHILNFVDHTPHLSVLSVDTHVALQAANVRAFLGFKPPDALVAGSGILAQVGILVANDTKWKRMQHFPKLSIGLCYLEDHVPL